MKNVKAMTRLAGPLAGLLAIQAGAGELSLGIAAGTQTTQYRDQDDRAFVVPVIAYEGERFSYFLDTAAFRLLAGELGNTEWRTRTLARARLFDQPDARAGLDKRKSTLDAGLELAAQGPWGSLSLEALTDTLGHHDGYEASLTYAYEFAITEKLALTPSMGATYYDEHLADYYFGVRAHEARPGRRVYQPGESGVASAGLTLTCALTPRWQLVGVLEYEVLGSALADSPLIANDSSTTAAVGVLYRFK
jgi:MipA family protein